MSDENAIARSGPMPEERSLDAIIEAISRLGQSRGSASVGDLAETLGRASGVAIMLTAAAIATTPLSGIPGLSGLCGIIIALSAGQLLFGRKCIWLPGFVNRRRVEGERLRSAIETLRKVARFLDRHTKERLTWFVRGPGKKLIQLLCMVGGACMPLLEIIPFSASIVGATVSLFSVALLTLDGLWAIFGFAFLATAATAVTLLI